MTRKLSREIWETLKAVSLVIGCHEMYDDTHPVRIAGYARMLGEEMGLDIEEVEQIEYAVLLHDIGQIKVRETILKNPGRLTRAEFFEEVVGLETTLKRPIINTRDEPHSDAERFRRLHVICGDANMSPVATLVTVPVEVWPCAHTTEPSALIYCT